MAFVMAELERLRGKTIALRADASPARGLGHVMRCLALSDTLIKAGAQCSLVTGDLPEQVEAKAKALGCTIISLDETFSADCLIIDSYDIKAGQRAALFDQAGKSVIIDDVGDNGPYDADVILNPNPGAHASLYGEALRPEQRLVGADYVLLRPEIIDAKTTRDFSDAQSVFISCGGSDPTQAGPAVVQALSQYRAKLLNIRILVGPIQDRSALNAALDNAPHRIELIKGTSAIQAHLNWADVAILAAGTTLWEAAYLGVPIVALVIADNQLPGSTAAHRAGALMRVDWRTDKTQHGFLAAFEQLMENAEQRLKMGTTARGLVDGRGAERVARRLAQIV